MPTIHFLRFSTTEITINFPPSYLLPSFAINVAVVKLVSKTRDTAKAVRVCPSIRGKRKRNYFSVNLTISSLFSTTLFVDLINAAFACGETIMQWSVTDRVTSIFVLFERLMSGFDGV